MRWIISGLLVVVLFCAHTPPLKAAPQAESSLAGNYLAGREASLARDDENAARFFIEALKSDPKNEAILEGTLFLLLKSGMYDRAAEVAGMLYDLNKHNVKASNFLALIALKNNDSKLALKYNRGTEEYAIGKISSALIQAWSLVADKQTDKAITLLDDLKAYDNFTSLRLYHSALIMDVSDNRKEADRLYGLAYKEVGQFLNLVLSYGSYLERTGRASEAVQIYQTYLGNNPNDAIVEDVLKNIARKQPNRRLVSTPQEGAAEAMFNISRATVYENSTLDLSLIYLRQSLFMNDDNDMAHSLMGQIYELTENSQKAIQAYEKITKRSPLYTQTVIQIAHNLNWLERKREARQKLRLLITRKSTDIDPVFGLGNILRLQGKHRTASKAYSRALKMLDGYKAHHWKIFYYRGVTYERTKNWERAEKDFLTALKLEPDQPDVLNYLGYSWIEQKKNLKKAMAMIERANKFKPNDGYIIDSLGWAHFKLGNFDKAVTILEHALYFKPEDPIINDHLGDAYWEVGRRLEAGFQWNHARFQLDKRLKKKKTLDDINRLKSVNKKIVTKSKPFTKKLKKKIRAGQGKPL